MNKIEKSEEYIKGVMETLKGRPDAKCIEVLREIAENGVIAHCNVMFSEHTIVDIIKENELKQYKKEAEE